MAAERVAKQEVRLLDALRKELEYLDSGGYSRTLGDGWRAPLVFEDSPICPNFRHRANPAPCSVCELMPLVPPEFRDRSVPCRFIQLNSSGETLDHLYRYADEHEVAATYRQWLVNLIQALEALEPVADVT
jgi:hypothetical protein